MIVLYEVVEIISAGLGGLIFGVMFLAIARGLT